MNNNIYNDCTENDDITNSLNIVKTVVPSIGSHVKINKDSFASITTIKNIDKNNKETTKFKKNDSTILEINDYSSFIDSSINKIKINNSNHNLDITPEKET